MNTADLLETLQAIDLLRDRPKFKPILTQLEKELEEYAEAVKEKAAEEAIAKREEDAEREVDANKAKADDVEDKKPSRVGRRA